MEKRFILLLATLFILANGYSQKEETINCDVRPVNAKLTIDGHQLFYALPKNTVHITIKVKQTNQTPGPYADFAEKYMNISDGVVQAEELYYEVTQITFERNSSPDSSCYYCINCLGLINMPELQLNADAVILGCNLPYSVGDYKISGNPVLNLNVEPDTYFFYDLGAIPFVEEKDEENPKSQPDDSSHVKVQVTLSKLEVTTEEHNAKEAADFILKLRKRRLKLLVGIKDESLAVEGQSMKIMVDEMNQLENKYLELFVGKTRTRELNYYFDFEPEAANEAEQKIIGWFSPNSGLVYSKPDIRKSDFKPLLLKAEVLGKIPEVTLQTMDNSTKNSVPIKYGLYYRIPGMISVSLQYSDQIMAHQKIQIAQKGRLLPLPSEYLNNTQYGIEFYPETGALKKIIQKEIQR